MKLGIISDIHLDHSDWNDFNPHDYNVDLWVNAGDTATNANLYSDFYDLLPNQFAVDGNHDLWKGTIFPPKNYCKRAVVNDVVIAGAPLWTDLSNPLNWRLYSDSINDRWMIGKDQWTHEVYMNHHEVQKKFLMESNADVIVSHHGPSYQSISPKFKGSNLNCAFVTELSEQILKMPKPPKLWIHGHVHQKQDYMIGNTRVISNPRGYPNEPNYIGYKPVIIEI